MPRPLPLLPLPQLPLWFDLPPLPPWSLFERPGLFARPELLRFNSQICLELEEAFLVIIPWRKSLTFLFSGIGSPKCIRSCCAC
jgi:hypothetical protein